MKGCKALLQDRIRVLEDDAYALGYAEGLKAGSESHGGPKAATTFNVEEQVKQGTKALVANAPSSALVALIFILLQPLLGTWPSLFVVLEVQRGPLKLGGDFAYQLSLYFFEIGVVPSRAQVLRFTFLYARALTLAAGLTNLVTQLAGDTLRFVFGQGPGVVPNWSDVGLVMLFTFVAGSVAVWLQGFVIYPLRDADHRVAQGDRTSDHRQELHAVCFATTCCRLILAGLVYGAAQLLR